MFFDCCFNGYLLQVIETLINDSKYTSFAAKYLREHKSEIDQLIKMKTKFGNTWKDVVKTGLNLL